MRRSSAVPLVLFASAASSLAAVSTLAAPGQPLKTGTPGQFEIVGNTLVSAQQLFLGTENKVYIVDKTENNPTQINQHPAWASEYNVDTNVARPMDVLSNSFCAGGGVLGNGTWMNVGGNQAVTYQGATAPSQLGGPPYDDLDGGLAFLDVCANDDNCNWVDNPALYMSTRRWYPTLETLEDGSIMILGGCLWGGFVNAASQNNPTLEYFPPRNGGTPIGLNILTTTLPANLYPITYLLPSGNIIIQTNFGTEIYDYKNNVEHTLANIPHAVRTYPASGATAMLPLTPANNWTATVIFCGGSNIKPDQWVETWHIAQYTADKTCVRMTPDVSAVWEDDDMLPEPRSMGNFILLPDGTLFMTNGAMTGVAGYGVNISWSIHDSYADHPITAPLIYDPGAPAGSRFSRAGLANSTINRMYHSTATLLPDGSVIIAGSNPHPDYTVGPNIEYPTEYRAERFYPSYYNKRRPQPQGLLSQLSYGGSYFNVTLTKDDLAGDIGNIQKTKVVISRTGFSTHAMNMGMRHVELDVSYTATADGATLHVSQLPANSAIIAPGPALCFVVTNGVPSVGKMIMLGNGQIGQQPVTTPQKLPVSSIPAGVGSGSSSGSGSGSGGKNAAGRVFDGKTAVIAGAVALVSSAAALVMV
ncbi:hypothetical protein BOTBODRAFT_26498 [Botryobasidium botryosum FD-172 SS1]|uniref:Glyoxal oxidase n=1 Tax=Botryobasidium botryosum (strain FD-172 SS1) TaxID=930990 RepID=A0A067MXZ4_BOTB1|nr:hypothetical protein BOTBODRAFT_26498 [Botryobasidium botryosum FD-172 SS1]